MQRRWTFPYHLGLALLGLALLLLPFGFPAASAQKGFNEFEVKSQPSGLDKDTVWTLDFRFKEPRIVKAYVPGRGTRLCWYLWYQVVNRTAEPHTLIPSFEIVTLDFPGAFSDEPLFTVQQAIQQIEDPTGYQNIQNSWSISAKPIPPTKAEDTYPRATTGVAIWDASSGDPKNDDPTFKQLSETTRFSIFVSGLSNGWVLVDPDPVGADTRPIVRRKTLQLNFRRTGGRFAAHAREFSFEAPAEWIYRSTRLRIPELKQNPPAGAEDNPKGAWLKQPQFPKDVVAFP